MAHVAADPHSASALPEESGELQERLAAWLDLPLTALALIMLGLLVLEYAVPVDPTWSRRIEQAQTAIWAIFAVDFLLELALAPSKRAYLRRNWLTAISVLLPAFRAVRIFRVARALRSLSLVRLITTLNRGTRALSHVVRGGQLGYVVALTAVVTVVGAAGALYFEQGAPGATILNFGDALWWAAAIVTTINSPLEVVTFEGRVIGLLVRVFGLAVSGYLTAIIAVYWLGGLRQPAESVSASELQGLRAELAVLRAELASWRRGGQSELGPRGIPDGPAASRQPGRPMTDG